MRKSDALIQRRAAALFSTLFVLPVVCGAQTEALPQIVEHLSLKHAVEIALAPNGNYQLQLAKESVHEAEARWGQSRASLLPSFEGAVTEQNQTLNLQALGLRFNIPVSGFTFPRSSGDFSTFDARLRVTDNLLDMELMNRDRASREGIHAAEVEMDWSKDVIASAVAKAYLAALRAESLVKVADANTRLSKDLLGIANRREATGTGTVLDVTRARAQLSDELERHVAAEHQLVSARLELLRLMHVGLDSAVELTDESLPEETAEGNLKDAIATGLASRADLSAKQKRELGARLDDSAVRSEAFPSLVAFADFGALGVGIDQSIATHTVGVSLRIPVFDGGRRRAERTASLTGLREAEIRSRDLHDRIELEVREAFEAAHYGREQMNLAEEGAQIARDELAQARRRYEAGVASNLELVQAEQTTALAEEKRIEATFDLRNELIDLWLATGKIRTRIQ